MHQESIELAQSKCLIYVMGLAGILQRCIPYMCDEGSDTRLIV
jgi:hypothetical protein